MGRMMNRLFRENGISVINIVRKDDQMQALHDKFGKPEEGVHCLNSESETFANDLKKLAKKINANLVLECVAGELTGIISESLPQGSTIVMYGQLSEQKI